MSTPRDDPHAGEPDTEAPGAYVDDEETKEVPEPNEPA